MSRPIDVPLDRDLLVEASAGTGKTYALTTLVARLIVESGWSIEKLLIVTFTIAATGELRARVRRTLRDALDVAQDRSDGDTLARALIDRWRGEHIDRAMIESRLAAALRDFHRANVMTIHGFCQRALTEFAFDARLPFGFTISGDDLIDVEASVRDFWRQHMAPEPIQLLEVAKTDRFDLPALTTWIGAHHAKPSVIRGLVANGYASALDAYRGAFQDARAAWADTEHRKPFLHAIETLNWNKNENAERLREILRAFEADDTDLLPLRRAGYFGRAALAGKLRKIKTPQQLPDVPLYDRFGALGAAADRLSHAWLSEKRGLLLESTRQSLRGNTRKHRRLSFNALLTELYGALGGGGGAMLAERIRARYPVALIDEFQDTDRLQAGIFENIYPAEDIAPASAPGRLMIVGDPKQSIYRFRGADVFAYLGASGRRHNARNLSLQRNYRSKPALVRAINAVFDRENPFLRPETIRFEPARSAIGASDGLRTRGGAKHPEPFQLHLFPHNEDGGKWTKGKFQEEAADQAANEIARLLSPGEAKLGVDGKSTALVGSDIAVLVRTGEQGRTMARNLREHGVQSIERGIDSVFETSEADQLGHLLRALATDPDQYNFGSLLRGALATDLFGLGMSDLAALQDDDDTWDRWRRWARDAQRTWNEKGIATLIRTLLFAQETNCAAHMLAYPDGTRRLTNALHLAELMQQAEADARLSPQGLVDWFARAAAHPESSDEDTRLRLESDEHLVMIVTIHRSKGLEFPVVFCPFAWDGHAKRKTAKTAEYHQQDSQQAILDMNPSQDAVTTEWIEEQADELRLLYVALTRAKYHCVVTWARVNYGEHAPLAWLIHGRELTGAGTLEAQLDDNAAHVKELDSETWLAEVRKFAKGHPDSIAIGAMDGATQVPPGPRENLKPSGIESLAAQRLDRGLARIRQRTSFSALTSDMGAATTPVEHEEIDEPDRDQDDSVTPDEGATPKPDAEALLDAFTFPRGVRTGNCLHDIFERAVAPGAELDEICQDALARHRIDPRWAPVARTMVDNARNSPLKSPSDGSIFRLAEVERPIAEMEFHLPLHGLDRARLGRCFAAHGYSRGFPDGASAIDGFLHGFIDVVARHGERWYVMDYKSNWLGDHIQAYSGRAMQNAMRAHGYAAQYLFYLTALHRFLRLRLPNYDYERHIGGVFYLFVRGMSPDMPGHGVYRDAPTRACIEAIDACFAGAGR